MKCLIASSAAAICLLTPVAAADSTGNLSEATGDSSQASARIAAAGGQVALGAVALPLRLGGDVTAGIGEAAGNAGEAMWEAANAPLKVDDRVAIADPAPRVPRLPAGDGDRS